MLLLEGAAHDTSHMCEVLVADDQDASDQELNRVLLRLHNNLGHPSPQELARVLKHGQASSRAITLAASLHCPACAARKGPSIPNPAQTSHVTVFNQKIGIDVKYLPGWGVNQRVKALNIVDFASNFQIMAPFFEKEPSIVLRQLLSERWLSWAGVPKEIVMDPAQTNLGRAFTEPCELEGSHISVTAAGAHWQHGKTEVHGGLFERVLSKVLEDRNPTNRDQWLDCVRQCHVKNSTIQTHGYTPSQVVFGRNPDLPGALLNEPQQVIPCTAGLLEDSVEKSQAIRHAAKKAILELQDSRDMRRALAARPRVARNFKAGDVVAYWRDQKWQQGTLSRGGRWYGSAVVLGHVGKNVAIIHRTHVLRCAPEQVRLATPEERQLIETPETQLLGVKDMLDKGTFRSAQYIDLLSQAYPPMEKEVYERALADMSEPAAAPAADLPERLAHPPIPEAPMEHPSEPVPEDDFQYSPTTPVDTPDEAQDQLDDVVPETKEPESANPSSGSDGRQEVDNPSGPSSYGPVRRRIACKAGPLTLHRPAPLRHDDFAEVMSEIVPHLIDQAMNANKREASTDATGHVDKSAKTDDTEILSAEVLPQHEVSAKDASDLWSALRDGVHHEALIAQYLQKRMQKELPHSNNEPWLQAQIDAAKTLEWNTLAGKQAVRLLSVKEANWVRQHKSERIMGSRFVLIKKAVEDIIENGITPEHDNPDHWKVKARWCLQGHLDPDLTTKAQEGMLQSPTLSQMARTVLFQLLASFQWQLQLGDIKGAFLEAGPLEAKYGPLYAKLPPGGLPGVDDEQLVEVLGNVYGQNDAPAAWYKVFDAEVQKAGFVRSSFDACLYFLRDDTNRLVGILGSHVDDTVTGGEGPVYANALKYLKNRFPYRKWRVDEGEFCGAHYKQDPKTKEITMNQNTFAQNLRPAYLPSKRKLQKGAPLDPKEISVLRAINGSLNWLASQTWRLRPVSASRPCPIPQYRNSVK